MGGASVDRSTMATLSTYNTWIQLESFAKELPRPTLQATLAIKPFTAKIARPQYGAHLSLVM